MSINLLLYSVCFNCSVVVQYLFKVWKSSTVLLTRTEKMLRNLWMPGQAALNLLPGWSNNYVHAWNFQMQYYLPSYNHGCVVHWTMSNYWRRLKNHRKPASDVSLAMARPWSSEASFLSLAATFTPPFARIAIRSSKARMRRLTDWFMWDLCFTSWEFRAVIVSTAFFHLHQGYWAQHQERKLGTGREVTTGVFRVVLQKQYVLSLPWLGRKWVWLGWRRGRWFLSPWAPNLGTRSFPTVTSAHGRLHVIEDISGRFFCWRWSWKLEDFFLVLPSFFILFSHFSHLFLFLSPPWISFSIQAGGGWSRGWKWTNWTTSTDQGWFGAWTGRVPCHGIYEGFKGHVEVDIHSRSHAMAQQSPWLNTVSFE